GLIIARFEWQWIFLINIPISALILLAMTAVRQEQQTMRKPIVFAGIVLLLLTVVLLAFMLGITMANGIYLVVGLVLLPVLVAAERKSVDPVMNIPWLRVLSWRRRRT